MLCPKCGQECGESKFCPECGTPLIDGNEPKAEEVAVDSPINENEGVVADEVVEKSEDINQDSYYEALKKIEDDKTKAKKEKTKKKAIGCCAVVLIILLAIAIPAIFNSKKDKGNNDSKVNISVSVIDNNTTDSIAEQTTKATITETTTEAAKTWFLQHYVDDFGEEVEDWWFIEGDFYGTFSNSATTNSKCRVRVFYDYEDRFGVFLYNYGTSQVKNSSSRYSENYIVKFKDSNGNVKSINAYIPTSGDRLYFENYDSLLNALKSGDVSVNLVEEDRQINTYNFKITSDNFADIYNQQK